MNSLPRDPFPISPAKRALMDATLRKEGLLPAKEDRIQPRAERGPAPLSFAQQRLWFFDQFEPGSPLYNLMAPILFEGQLKADALEKAFNRIVERHEALRTTFDFREGEPVQIVAAVQPLKMGSIDLTGLHEDEQRRRMESIFEDEASRPFDLKHGPLLRTTLLRLGSDKNVLLFAIHHIVSDAWSTALLIHELGEIYDSLVSGRHASLPHLPIQYADFAVWQRQWLQGALLEQQLEFWKGRLGNDLPVLELPSDRPRPAMRTFNGSSVAFSCSPALSQSLKVLCQQERVTPFMVLLAAFKVLLHRYTGLQDFAVGIPIANRQRQEVENLIGFFTNTLAIRTDLSGNPTFRDLLSRVRENLLDAYAHQDLPFEYLVEQLHPERSLSHSPLVQVMFVLKNVLEPDLKFPGVKAIPLSAEFSTAKFDLSFYLDDRSEQLHGIVEYNTDLFERGRIERMASHFEILVGSILENPARPISDLRLLTQVEENQLLKEWNRTQAPYSPGCVHQLFEAQTQRTPDSTALIFENTQLSYAALNTRANQIAHYLHSRELGPGAIIALLMDPSSEMLASLLGILKIGAACLPLNSSDPEQRLEFMLQDSRAQAVLVQGRLASKIPRTTTPIIQVDLDWESISRQNQTDPREVASPESPIYVIYTSGSTGIPKAVVMPHRALVNLVDWHRATGSYSGRVLQFAALTFDVSFQEIFSTLATGGTLVLLPSSAKTDLKELASTIEKYSIERFHLPVVVLQKLAEEFCENPRPLFSLRELMVGGEQLQITSPVENLLQTLGGCTLYNHYGPSETHVVTSFRLPGSSATWPTLPPLGRPIANTHAYVLDTHFQPVPVGIAGELYLGGECLAHGYLNRAALTAERFVPDPFSGSPGARIYKTGDVVRYLPSGDIEFLGRNDFQVKIRGMRIELGEIEAQLRRHPGIREAVVVVRNDGAAADKSLAAYLVANPSETINVKEVREFLRTRVPEHMVPSHFVVLADFPLTSSGKINRLALPAPETLPELASDHVPPQTAVEKVLAAIFSEVLGRQNVGLFDKFFDLGGHSLMATQVASRVRTAFQIELPVRVIFEEPTVAGLARSILKGPSSRDRIERTAELLLAVPSTPPEEMASSAAGLPLNGDHNNRANGAAVASTLEIQPSREAPPVLSAVEIVRSAPLSFAQQRLWFLDQYQPQSTLYNLPAALRLSGPLDVSAFETSLNEIVKRHESLRTTFGAAGEQPMQIVHRFSPCSLPVTDIQPLSADAKHAALTSWITEEAERPFDLVKGPLLRTHLLRLGPEDHIFLVAMHHIVSDGWSLQIFVRELATLYESFRKGNRSPLPDLAMQYADFAFWQRRSFQAEELARELAYWKTQLADAPLVLELPSDRPRPVYKTFNGAAVIFPVAPALAHDVVQLARRESATLFMTLLAAFYVLLYRYTGQHDILIGTPIANRNRKEIEELIGFFVNTVVVRARLSPDMRFRELLRAVRETCLDAYSHQDVPFEKLVEEIRPERNFSHSPLFQTMFHLQNVLREDLFLAGLSITPIHTELKKAKFDVSLALTETSDGLTGVLNYNTDLFNADSAARMAGHFHKILESAVAAPNEEISTLCLLSAEESRKVLVTWNDFRRDYERNRLVHEVLEEQAQHRPGANAVRFQDRILSYGELNRRANQLAHRLRKLGVGPETVVGICVERSLEMMIALFGILKSGAAYLPLDPSWPAARLAFMLEDAGASVIITHHDVAQQLPQNFGKRLYLDSEERSLACESSENLAKVIGPSNLAYVIYTSGSTGKPKGIMVEHGNLANYVGWAAELIFDQQVETVPAVQGLTFDGSLKQIFAPILHGLEIWVLSKTEMADPASLISALAKYKDIRFSAVPSLWKGILDAVESGQAILPEGMITRAFIGGEELPKSLADRSFALIPDLLLWNFYGPSEITATASAALIRPGEDITIGYPIAGKKIHILDEKLQPVPVGVAGEIYIGREGLARGYMRRPDLTAAAFVPDAFSNEPGARLYRTRDRARYLYDGRIQFLGRFDNQVKLRGFRIELGEIEMALREHQGVADAVAAIRNSAEGEPYLTAYIVPRESVPPAPGELRAFLKEKLPEYMLPSAWLTLDAFPLTPSGKLDRAALPEPERAKRDTRIPFVAARTAVEELLTGIFAEVLEIGQVGIHDNFFELGGHSLAATRVVGRIRKIFNVKFPLRRFFEQPTVAEIATELSVNEEEPRRAEETAALLRKLDSLSADDLEDLLKKKRAKEGR